MRGLCAATEAWFGEGEEAEGFECGYDAAGFTDEVAAEAWGDLRGLECGDDFICSFDGCHDLCTVICSAPDDWPVWRVWRVHDYGSVGSGPRA
jgi:hypothetical protein